ncbi:MAG: hypothetical protein AB8B63_00680 [Granulosicoccus sp.]
MNKLLTLMLLLIAPLGVNAGAIDLALSDETAYLSLIFDTDPLYSSQFDSRDGGSEVSIGAFISESDDNLLHATLIARGYKQANLSVYQISAGMKLIGGDIEIGEEFVEQERSETVGALALGFQAGLILVPAQYNPVELTFEGFYAPSITSFSDAERYGEISARLQVDVTSRARAYIGYRRMRFDTNEFENVTLDRSAHFGLVLLF